MKIAKLTTIRVFLCLLLLNGITMTSCIKDDDDPEAPVLPITDSIPSGMDTTQIVIDSVFQATVEYMQREWMGQYSGFDPMQSASLGVDVISNIRRLVYFAQDGSYDSHVQGIVNANDTITTYKEFEHEHGTYAFNQESQLMTYTVEYDSLLDFRSDVMILNLMVTNHYTERIWFSKELEGRRDWIRTDQNLKLVDDHTKRVIYIMKNQ